MHIQQAYMKNAKKIRATKYSISEIIKPGKRRTTYSAKSLKYAQQDGSALHALINLENEYVVEIRSLLISKKPTEKIMGNVLNQNRTAISKKKQKQQRRK